ncbi:hypothetical protein [Streptomyces sp. NPDC127108]|uniref:hypothetical protein n=1 Tax=Streptomyces sp. NPDC127108 TaxID=3345361 RepID=UPI00362F760B
MDNSAPRDEVPVEELHPADFDHNNNHTMLATKVRTNGNSYLTYRASNVYNRNINRTLRKRPRTWWSADRA